MNRSATSRILHALHRSATVVGGLVLLGVTTSASAVYLSPNGFGQALVYPYYTVNGGQDTLLTLVNEGGPQAIKIRFLEGYNGRDVLDVNLYLYSGDVWTGVVTASGDGAALFSPDAACTVPALLTDASHALTFSTQAFDGAGVQGADGGPTDLARTREGHIEVITMGTVTGDSLAAMSPDGSVQPPATLYAGAGGPPNDCARLVAAWASGGYWARNPTVDMTAPDGGLSGSASIVNVERGTVQGYVADAIAAFYEPGTGGLSHSAPDSLVPTLVSGSSHSALIFPARYSLTDVGPPVQASFSRSIDAVSAVFMAGTLINEFVTNPAIGAASEWVVTYPTKRFYSDPYYVGVSPAPLFPIFNVDPAAPGTACTAVDEAVRDRANTSFAFFPDGFVGTIPPLPKFCYSTQIVTFNQGSNTDIFDFAPVLPSRVLQSTLVTANINAPFDAGVAEFSLGDDYVNSNYLGAQLVSRANEYYSGQPVTGFLATEYVNGNVDGALANYTLALRHKTYVLCAAYNTGNNGILNFCGG